MRAHQLSWARDGGVPPEALEWRHGQPSWVLKKSFERSNLFDPAWWMHITGKEHLWARALNSSQCFAVNLFAPLTSNQEALRLFLQQFIADQSLELEDEICLRFEHTPPGAPEWMGEAGQPTQTDAFFALRRHGRAAGFVLVEVKLSETKIGSCRGWNGKEKENGDSAADEALSLRKPHITWAMPVSQRIGWIDNHLAEASYPCTARYTWYDGVQSAYFGAR